MIQAVQRLQDEQRKLEQRVADLERCVLVLAQAAQEFGRATFGPGVHSRQAGLAEVVAALRAADRPEPAPEHASCSYPAVETPLVSAKDALAGVGVADDGECLACQ